MANPVLSFPEQYRLAHAFLGGHPYAPGDVVYVIFSRAAPLFRIQGIYRQRAEAKRELATAPPEWEPAELNARIIYKVTMPDDPPVSIDPLDDRQPPQTLMYCAKKAPWTEATFSAIQACAEDDDMPLGQRAGAVLSAPASIHDVTRMELRLWTSGGRWCVELPSVTEAVFLTVNAIDSILIPYYHAVFGRRHAEQRRRSLFNAAHRAASGAAGQRPASGAGRAGRGGASRSKRKRG